MSRARLAPTPSGALHLGNALAFGVAWLDARAQGQILAYRLEDIDTTRARPQVARALLADLDWLGINFDERMTDQSKRAYTDIVDRLAAHTYRCTCPRRELQAHTPCACPEKHHRTGALRLRLPRVQTAFLDRAYGPQRVVLSEAFADPVLVRADGVVSYNLAVVADDIRDDVTSVVRGADLLEHTALQCHLHALFGHPPPTWLHVPILLGPDGKKLSKSHQSKAIATLRDEGVSPAQIWRALLPLMGLAPASSLREALPTYEIHADPHRLRTIAVGSIPT